MGPYWFVPENTENERREAMRWGLAVSGEMTRREGEEGEGGGRARGWEGGREREGDMGAYMGVIERCLVRRLIEQSARAR